MKMTIELTDNDKGNLKRGIQQFPWFEDKIKAILQEPTEEKIGALLSENVEGSFKANLVEISSRIENKVAH